MDTALRASGWAASAHGPRHSDDPQAAWCWASWHVNHRVPADQPTERKCRTDWEMIMPSREYEDYLNSPAWKVRRAQQLSRDGYRCRNCHTQARLQVHHFSYQHDGVSILGKESADDLVTLCEACHVALTQRRQLVFRTGPRSPQAGFLWIGFFLVVGFFSAGYIWWVWLAR